MSGGVSPIALGVLLTVPFFGPDPAPSLTRTLSEARQYDCRVVEQDVLARERPGLVRTPRPRGGFGERTYVVCTEALLPPDARHPRDAAVLERVGEMTEELASVAAATWPDLSERSWLVEVYYPNAQVSPKIAFATKDALVRKGLRVSDRTPLLAAGDVEVLTRMPPSQAYPAACARYARTGSLGADDALLAVLVRDPRETILHGGVCADGTWTWLR